MTKLWILVLLINPVVLRASQKDTTANVSVSKVPFFKKQILPVSLIVGGSLLTIGDIKYNIQDKLPNTNTSIDDVLEYTPMAQMYVYDALGFQHKNTVWDQTKYLAIAQLISFSTTQLLKGITNVERPNMSDNSSFPSGHTANAFTGATVLYHEFKDTEPLLAWSGYVFATATGVLRMTNDAHWLPDVLVGAGIGILASNLVYYFEPLKNWQPFKKKDIAIMPIISPKSVGILVRL